jgi:PAS domain S-box-containing protein
MRAISTRKATTLAFLLDHGALRSARRGDFLAPGVPSYERPWIVWKTRLVGPRRPCQNQVMGKQSSRRPAKPPSAAALLLIDQQDSTAGELQEARKHFEKLLAGVGGYSILLLDRSGRIVASNVGAETIFGYRREEIVGRHFSTFHRRDAVSGGRPGLELEFAAGTGRLEEEGWRVCKDGSAFWANVTLSALHDSAGKHYGFLEVVRDFTQRRLAEQTLRESEERFRMLVEEVRDYAIFLLDTSGRVTTWNEGAQRIKGYNVHEIIGEHFSRFYPEEAIRHGWPEEELRRAAESGRFEDEGWRVRKDGSQFWANVSITALRDSDGALRGYSKITRDLTERRKAEESLRASHTDLESRVAERTAELTRVNEMLRSEVEIRARLETDLRNRVEQLRDSDRQKNNFLATLAHELRNPLAPIRNAAELMRRAENDPQTIARAQGIVERQVSQMVRLIDDLLDLSRISRGRIDLRLEAADLRSSVRSGVETSRPLIDDRGHQLLVTLPDAPLPVKVDPVRISQVIANLLNNAAKFTPAGGAIVVEARCDSEWVLLSIADNGIGIDREVLPRIFEPFAQRGSPEFAQGGLGIGLSIVEQLVVLHGGRIEASSEGRGRGSTFTIRLPLASLPVDHAAAAPEHASGSPEQTRILVVDDNREAAETLGMLLQIDGNVVATAHDGLEALACGDSFRPDVVLLDLGMPRMNGYETARRMRERDWGLKATLVALTGWGQDTDRKLSKAAGFDLHVVKPVDAVELERAVARLRRR